MSVNDQPIPPQRSLTQLFRPDAATSLLRARMAFDTAESKIQELSAARTAALRDIDDDRAVDEIQRIDHEIAAQQNAASIYHERIGALLEKQRDDDHGKREAEKIAAVAEIGRRMTRRQSAAKRFDEATEVYIAAIGKLKAADAAVFANWPSILPRELQTGSLQNLGAFKERHLTAKDFSREFGTMGTQKIRGTLRALVEIGSFEMAATTSECDAELIRSLEEYQIPQPIAETPDDEEVAA